MPLAHYINEVSEEALLYAYAVGFGALEEVKGAAPHQAYKRGHWAVEIEVLLRNVPACFCWRWAQELK